MLTPLHSREVKLSPRERRTIGTVLWGVTAFAVAACAIAAHQDNTAETIKAVVRSDQPNKPKVGLNQGMIPKQEASPSQEVDDLDAGVSAPDVKF